MKKKYMIIILCLLTLAMTLFVFERSMKSAAESSAESRSVLSFVRMIEEFLHLPFRLTIHQIRKMAHFIEYFVLGALASVTALVFWNKREEYAPVGSFYALLIAFLDEFFFQKKTPGRGPSFRDVLIDFAGAFLAMLLIAFLEKASKNRKNILLSRGKCEKV